MRLKSKLRFDNAFTLDPALRSSQLARASDSRGVEHAGREPFLEQKDGAKVRAMVVAVSRHVAQCRSLHRARQPVLIARQCRDC